MKRQLTVCSLHTLPQASGCTMPDSRDRSSCLRRFCFSRLKSRTCGKCLCPGSSGSAFCPTLSGTASYLLQTGPNHAWGVVVWVVDFSSVCMRAQSVTCRARDTKSEDAIHTWQLNALFPPPGAATWALGDKISNVYALHKRVVICFLYIPFPFRFIFVGDEGYENSIQCVDVLIE